VIAPPPVNRHAPPGRLALPRSLAPRRFGEGQPVADALQTVGEGRHGEILAAGQDVAELVFGKPGCLAEGAARAELGGG
jgi:hypothetical protein